jgi:hypothetical protein
MGKWWTPGENPGSWVLSDLQHEASQRRAAEPVQQGWLEMYVAVKDVVLRTLSLCGVTAGRTALNTNTLSVGQKTP